ncbi:unnamed protein product [Allacma fusca]|uniref:Homeobox domain-containing protein n=1 Tax=Allacma fusca TaxID=39272 RepID=A0A8J2L7A4_9HEXA|nr:unnamed protein product [Allacma fusca]
MGSGHPVGINLKSYHTHHEDHRGGGDNYSSQCSECFFLSRYCRRIQFPTTTPASVSPSSFAWIPPPTTSHPADSNSTILSSNSFGQHLHLSSYGLNNSNFSNMSSMVSCNTNGSGRRKRSWSRAVFSNLQRKGLEKRFQLQKYITKPDRRQLAATLGLTDAQVKVWFQNRRMKWRHSKEGKQGTHIAEDPITGLPESRQDSKGKLDTEQFSLRQAFVCNFTG